MWEYRSYKRDTRVMLEWLEKTAALCGWRVPPAIQTSPQVTSSVDETRIPNIKHPVMDSHRISTQVLLQQAKVVSESTDPRTTIPQTIYDAALRAIATRR